MISILLLVVFFQSLLLIYPLFKRKFSQRTRIIPVEDTVLIQDAVVRMANTMLSSQRVLMSFNDDESLYAILAHWKNRALGKNSHQSYKYFNFPLSFLLLGLLDDYVSSHNEQILRNVERKCETLLNNSGELKFTLDKIDQATFGLVFLRLYELTHKEHYLTGANHIYEGIQVFKGEEGLYRYRSGLNIFFIDTVGLLCPFLMRYACITNNPAIKSDAEYQIKFALKHCVEPKQGLAVHAFDLTRNQPLGSVNWARGTGWLLLGLSAVAQEDNTSIFMNSMRHYNKTLMDMREEHGFWPQFLGHTNDKAIDSSGTLMFLYAFQLCRMLTINSALIKDLASQCIDVHGQVIKASGDTIYINKYSRIKGPSELTQGLMLSILAGMK